MNECGPDGCSVDFNVFMRQVKERVDADEIAREKLENWMRRLYDTDAPGCHTRENGV